MIRASFSVEIPEDAALISALNVYIDENMKEIAEEVATETRQRTPIRKGLLVKSVRSRKSRFEGGGYLVVVKAPHAHLVEYGHDIVSRSGKVVGRVRAYPFLRPSVQAVARRVAARAASSRAGA